jgi:hypothetical protein
MAETGKEKLDRLRMMADQDECWDLSDKDRAAIEHALKMIASMSEHIEQCTGRSRKYVIEAHSGRVEEWQV